jgi:HAD superfamily hydrolase (TIGR01549 family)
MRWKKLTPMIKAVLLDLDDTLLANPTRQFTANYLDLLDRFLRDRLGIDGIIDGLMAGTRAVIQNGNPLKTNWETFYEALDPLLPVSRAVFDPVVNEFYQTVYPQLEANTQKRPGARRLVDGLLEQGYAVVVATNPFFPRVAVEQRLAWAGLPVNEIPFALVTVLENMHYAKPHPAYYEEVLARLGFQADEAIMVGDDWENDIIPAWQAGLNTYWVVSDSAGPPPPGHIQPDGYGTLADFACRVQDENWLEALTPRPHDPNQIGPRLSGNLAALWSMVADIPTHTWPMRPDSEEWSPIETLCHLAESERDVQRPRLQLIVETDNPFLSQPKEPPRPAARLCPESAWQVARAFARERLETVAYLTGLADDVWSRPARHYIFGPTTLLEMVNFTAQHDRLHMVQLCQTVWKCL